MKRIFIRISLSGLVRVRVRVRVSPSPPASPSRAPSPPPHSLLPRQCQSLSATSLRLSRVPRPSASDAAAAAAYWQADS
eukprot:1750361-Rhodomonas_salina.1